MSEEWDDWLLVLAFIIVTLVMLFLFELDRRDSLCRAQGLHPIGIPVKCVKEIP